jgi:mannosyltransferase
VQTGVEVMDWATLRGAFPKPRIDRILFAVMVGAAAALRLFHLGQPSLWIDEAHTWWLTQLPIGTSLQVIWQIGVHPPAYFLLERGVVALVGTSEAGLRALSVLSDLISILVAGAIGRRVSGSTGAFVAGFFWSFNPLAVWYAREARPYSLAALLCLLLLLLYIESRTHDSSRFRVAIVLVASLALLTHFFSLLTMGGILLMALARLRHRPGVFRAWAAGFLLACIPLAGWLGWYFAQPSPSLGIGWIRTPIPGDILLTAWNLVSGYGGAISLASSVFGLAVAILALLGTLDRERLGLTVLLCGVVGPIGLTWLISQHRSIYMDRYFIVLLPFLVVLVALGVPERLRALAGSRLALVFTVGVALAIGWWSAWQVQIRPAYSKEDWRGLAQRLEAVRGSNEVIWLSDSEVLPALEYYGYQGQVATDLLDSADCRPRCLAAIRQPYTATHAFSQAVGGSSDPASSIRVRDGCTSTSIWRSPTGISLWEMACSRAPI